MNHVEVRELIESTKKMLKNEDAIHNMDEYEWIRLVTKLIEELDEYNFRLEGLDK